MTKWNLANLELIKRQNNGEREREKCKDTKTKKCH